MPLNNSSDKKNITPENSSTSELKIQVEPEYYNKDYAAFYLEQLKLLHITVDQQCAFTTHIVKAIHDAKLHNPDVLPFLWEKETSYKKLITLFFKLIDYNYLIKKDPQKSVKLHTHISDVKNNITSVIKHYELNKADTIKYYNFGDKGPQLTEHGIVFQE